MKKQYQKPFAEVALMEAEQLMDTSEPILKETIDDQNDILSRMQVNMLLLSD